jgi:hypothetical protein
LHSHKRVIAAELSFNEPSVRILNHIDSMRNAFGGRSWHSFWIKGTNVAQWSGSGLPLKAGDGRPQLIRLVRGENTGAEAAWAEFSPARKKTAAFCGEAIAEAIREPLNPQGHEVLSRFDQPPCAEPRGICFFAAPPVLTLRG